MRQRSPGGRLRSRDRERLEKSPPAFVSLKNRVIPAESESFFNRLGYSRHLGSNCPPFLKVVQCDLRNLAYTTMSASADVSNFLLRFRPPKTLSYVLETAQTSSSRPEIEY